MQVMIRCRQISICLKKSIDFQRVRMEHHKPPTNGSSNGNSSSSSSSRAYNTEANFDTNMVIILAALLCALICALGLNSIVRCALRCGRRFAFQSAGETAARFAARGIKKSTLRRIPVTAYGSGTCTGIRATECPICLGEFVEGEKLRVLPKCNHGFHVKCIDTWLVSHSSCPTCRHSLLDRPTGPDVDSGPAPATGENSVVVDLDDIG